MRRGPSSPSYRYDIYDELLMMLAPIFAITLSAALLVGALLYPLLWLAIALGGGAMRSSVLDVAWGIVQLPRNMADPAQAWSKDAAQLPGPVLMYLLLALMFAALTGLVMLAARLIAGRRFGSKRDRDSRWGTRASLKDITGSLAQLRGARGRVIVGRFDSRRYVATRDFASLLVVGPPGSGKTRGVAIPTLLEHDGPAIAASVKMDLAAETIAARNELEGGRALVYDPTRATPINDALRCGWTPLARCRTWAGTKRMAHWLCSVQSASAGDDKFWRDSAAMLLEPALFAFANTPGKTIRDVIGWVQNTADTIHEAWYRIEEGVVESEHSDRGDQLERNMRLAKAQLEGVFAWDEKTIAGARTTAMNVLKAYSDPDLLDVDAAHSVDLRAFLGGRNTLYLCAPLGEQEFLAPVFAAMVKDIITTAYDCANEQGGELRLPLLVQLDEVANITPINDLDKIATTCRGAGITLVTLTQSYSQLVDRWGAPRAKSIFEGHSGKALLKGSTDTELLGMFRKLIGDQEERRTTRSRSSSGESTSEQLRDRALAAEHELRALEKNQGVLVYGSNEPTKFRLRHFYADADMAQYRQTFERVAILNTDETVEQAL